MFLTEPMRSNASLTEKGVPGVAAVFAHKIATEQAARSETETYFAAETESDRIKFRARYALSASLPTFSVTPPSNADGGLHMSRPMQASLVLAALPFLLWMPDAAQRRSMNVTTNVRHGETITSCDQLDVRFDDAQTFRAEEHRTLARSAVGTLTAEGARNGGIYVHGWDRDEYDVTLCKAAAGWAAGGTLTDISLSLVTDRVTINGPSSLDGWVAYLIIAAPRGGALDLTTRNGPMALNDIAGTVSAHTTNGPIHLENCSGTMAIDAQNGPVHITGASGSIRAHTQNGPISVKLTGSSWSGAGLDARANNGPLSLDIPERYDSGVEVELSAHSPFHCRGAACAQANRDWDDRSKTLRFGGQPTVVRLGTVNGPVSIESRP